VLAPKPKPAPPRRRGWCCGHCRRVRVSPEGPEKAVLAAQARALAAAQAAEAEAEFELRRVEEAENYLRTLRGKLATVLMRAQVTTAALAAYFLVGVIFGCFLLYMALFGAVQGAPLLRTFGANWGSGQCTRCDAAAFRTRPPAAHPLTLNAPRPLARQRPPPRAGPAPRQDRQLLRSVPSVARRAA
jgi:hypothetical protein